jgi:GrpB-like predicted nucleotidyltransferase (UPF0157 family)
VKRDDTARHHAAGLCVDGGIALERDYLRAHPFAAEAYALVKLTLAQHGPTDWDLYYDVKDPVCDAIMVAAADWAGSVGWRAEHYS